MKKFSNSSGNIGRALALHEKGLRLVPLMGKRALVKEWQHLHLDESDVRSWFRQPGINIGIITGEPLVVVDTDSDEAEIWVKENGISSTTEVRSGRGGLHRYFIGPAGAEIHSKQGLHGIHGLDVKAWHSYIVAAGSIHPQTGKQYEYVPGKQLRELHDLPVFDQRWLVNGIRREPQHKPKNKSVLADGKVNDIRAYIRAIPSVQGQNGSNACYRVACLLYDAGYDFDRALDEMERWNEICAIPQWSREELIHKITDVFTRKCKATH